ncbi:NAD(P)-dependent oxidoreductase [Salinarimonas sp.]|uniref:NAD(P)-dependent oxidoreductase n=1 Tax=Salinarimonas sp. TaxID=2766526 RepID=UPI00391BF2D3
MRITIVGATRGIGKALSEQARALGHHVVAVGRSIPEGAARARFTPINGSILEEDVAQRALEGADALAICLGSNAYGPDLGRREVTIFSRATALLLAAMRGAGTMRVVAITGVGTAESRGQAGLLTRSLAMPLALGAIYADKARQEELLRDSDRDFTILRPSLLTNGPYTGAWTAIDVDEPMPGQTISRADCADACLRAIAEGAWSRRAMTITGTACG